MVFWHAPTLARQTLIRHFRKFDTRCVPGSEVLTPYIVFKIFTFPLIYLSTVCTSFLLFPSFSSSFIPSPQHDLPRVQLR